MAIQGPSSPSRLRNLASSTELLRGHAGLTGPQIGFDASPEIRAVIARIGRTEDIVFSPDDRRLAIVDYLADRIFFFAIRIDQAGAAPRIAILDHSVLASSSLKSPHGVTFLDADHILVCSRSADIAVFRVPPAGEKAEAEAHALATVRGKGLFARVKSPGSADSYPMSDGRYRVLVCNNNWHMITAHVVTLGDRVAIAGEGILIEHGLRIPDGISISPDHAWIAVSNHVDGTILVFRNDAALNRKTPATAVLRGIVCPHGLRFSPDGKRIFVADAASPYLHVFECGDGWQDVRGAGRSVRLLDDETFYLGRYDAREGGIKGIDLDNRGAVLATTLKDGVIDFYDVEAVLAEAGNADDEMMADLVRERDRSLAREDGDVLARHWTFGYRAGQAPRWLRRRLGLYRNFVRDALKLQKLRSRNRRSAESLLDPSGPIVSMTSHGLRLGLVFYAVEAIGLGRRKPSRMVLWLGDEAYAGRPDTLRRLEARGLEVRRAEDLGPHTKYCPFVERETAFALPLVTADDDVLYPPEWLEGLIAAHRSDPSAIHCYRAERITLSRGRLAPFGTWESAADATPSRLNFITGVSGAVYPPAFLKFLKKQGRGFVERCLKNDDVWLTVNALRSGTRVAQVGPRSLHFTTIPGSQAEHLSRHNIGAGGTQHDLLATFSAADLAALDLALAAER